MNKFIVLIPEEYDQFTVEIPFPIITAMTFEQCKSWLIDLCDAACFYENMDKRIQNHMNEPTLLLGTYLLHTHQLCERDGMRKYRPIVPRLLELNDWLLEANINYTREKPIL